MTVLPLTMAIVTSTAIPTCAVKLTRSRGMGAKGKFRPVESDIFETGKNWGMYPLIKVRLHCAEGNTA